MYDFYIGIDLGINGGIAILDSYGKIHTKMVMPTVKSKGKSVYNINAIFNILSPYQIYKTFLIFEHVHAMPGYGECKHGSSASFSLGYAAGIFKTIATITKMPFLEVPPKKWSYYMHSGLPKSLSTKERSLMACKKLFPNVDLRPSERCRVFHNGMVDALLLAQYAKITQ